MLCGTIGEMMLNRPLARTYSCSEENKIEKANRPHTPCKNVCTRSPVSYKNTICINMKSRSMNLKLNRY